LSSSTAVVYLPGFLKGQCHEIFCFWFFDESVSPQPQSIALGPFQIFSKIRGDNRKARCTTGINVTGGKFATSVNDTGGKIATSINDTGGKFATGVNDTGGKIAAGINAAAGMTPEANCHRYQ
jgi:hypothetical protein